MPFGAIPPLIAALISTPAPCQAPGSAPRLDHVIVAVADLEATAARFRGAGYRIKPGRPHPNGLLNNHVKFRDGTEIELMTVTGSGTDRMAREYRALIDAGDGGAYVALRLPSLDSAEAIASRLGLSPRRTISGAWQFLGFPAESPLGAIFFLSGGLPPVDPDSILTHADSAVTVIGASVEAGSGLVALLEALGAVSCDERAAAPGRVVALGHGRLVVVPAPAGRLSRVTGAVLGRKAGSTGTFPARELVPGFRLDH